MQLIGGVLIVVSLYLKEHTDGIEEGPQPTVVHISLTMEFIGLAFLISTKSIYTVAVVKQNGGLPLADVTWVNIFIILYFLRRANEVRNKLKRLRK